MKKSLYLTSCAIIAFSLAPTLGFAAPKLAKSTNSVQSGAGLSLGNLQNLPIPAGVQKVTLTFEGKERYYLIYVPSAAKGKRNNSMLMVLHGGYGSAAQMANMPDVREQSDKEGFIVVYPNALGSQFNDGREDSPAKGIDDVGYIRAVIKEVVKKQGVSPKKVFSTGISNGGFMSTRLACEATDLVAGIATVSSLMYKHSYETTGCHPSRAIPVMMFNGTNDPLALFEGGVSSMYGISGSGVLSFSFVRDFWVKQNRCEKPVSSKPIDKVDDHTSVTVQNTQCSKGVKGRFFVIEGGGHNWPGGPNMQTEVSKYNTREIIAAEEMVRFFKPYGL